MDGHSYLSLLGLALRGGRLAVGADAVEAATRARSARLLLLSGGVSGHSLRKAARMAEQGACLLLPLPCTREELGAALGKAPTAMVALTDTGLARAVGERLAALDPERYGTAAEKLRQKEARARERKSARKTPAGKKRTARPARAKRTVRKATS